MVTQLCGCLYILPFSLANRSSPLHPSTTIVKLQHTLRQAYLHSQSSLQGTYHRTSPVFPVLRPEAAHKIMKSASILITAVLSSFAAADVQVFTDAQCGSNKILVGTKAGNCYNLDAGKHSAKGCSVGHNLRVYTSTNCNGIYQERRPQACANLGNDAIGSIKCID
jgi:hypothetical protein